MTDEQLAYQYCIGCGDRGGWYSPDDGTFVSCKHNADALRAREAARSRLGVWIAVPGPPPVFACRDPRPGAAVGQDGRPLPG